MYAITEQREPWDSQIEQRKNERTYKYLVNKGENADSSNIPLCAIIGLMYGIKNKDTIFTKCSAVALFVGIACIVYTLLVIKST